MTVAGVLETPGVVVNRPRGRIPLQAIEDALEHAEKSWPHECVGAIVGGVYDGRTESATDVVAIDGEIHTHVNEAFRSVYARHSGEVDAWIHSHPHGVSWPSERDMRTQIETEVPHGIVSLRAVDVGSGMAPSILLDRVVFFGQGDAALELPGAQPPWSGRPWLHGVHDCWTLAAAWLRHERGWTPPPIAYSWGWQRMTTPPELFLGALANEPTCRVVPRGREEPGDLLLFRFRAAVIEHCGILLDDGTILHHPGATTPFCAASLSRTEPVERYLPYHCLTVRVA